MSALLLRNEVTKSLRDEYEANERHVVNDKGDLTEAQLRSKIGYMRGLQWAVDNLDAKFSEQNSR